MFPEKINFKDELEKNEYVKYITSRGRGVYDDSLKALLTYTGNDSIDYSDFMGFIRYDKNLRDILYKMLGVLEEFLKDTLYKLIDYNGDKEFGKINKSNIDKFKRISTKEYGWNMYRNPRLEFGSIVYLYKYFQFNTPSNSIDYIEDLENVNNLRNLVMHHKMLLIDQTKWVFTKNDIDNRICLLKKFIYSLYNLLQPTYNKGLITMINRANYDKKNNCIKSRFIYLSKIDGGYEND